MLERVARRKPKARRIPLAEAERLAAELCAFVRPHVVFSQVVGSVSRQVPEIGDVELVVLPKDLDGFMEFLREHGWTGGTRVQRGLVDDVKAELWIAHAPEELGAMVFAYVGDYVFEIAMRSIVRRRGLRLDQRGVWRGKKLIFQSPYEEDFFEFLGVDWHEPWERNFALRPKGFKREKRPGARGPREERREICGLEEEWDQA